MISALRAVDYFFGLDDIDYMLPRSFVTGIFSCRRAMRAKATISRLDDGRGLDILKLKMTMMGTAAPRPAIMPAKWRQSRIWPACIPMNAGDYQK